jgi:hypothetical protein
MLYQFILGAPAPLELPTRKNTLSVFFTITLLFFTFTYTGSAQGCACVQSVFNIGSTHLDEVSLSHWQSGQPQFNELSLKNGCLNINGTFVIDQNLRLNGTKVNLSPGAALIVKEGCSLRIDSGSELSACSGQLWQGITVMPGASLTIQNAKIQHALVGVRATETAVVRVSHTLFSGNYIGLDLRNIQGPDHLIFRNVFRCAQPLLPDWEGEIWATHTVAGIRVIESKNLLLRVNHFSDMNTGILIEYSDSIAVVGGSFRRINGFDNESGSAIHLLHATHIKLSSSKYHQVDIGLLNQNSDVEFFKNHVNANYYGISTGQLENKNIHIHDNHLISGEFIGVYISENQSIADQGKIEINLNKKIFGQSGIVVWKNTTPLWIHQNTEIRGYLYDGLQLDQCSGSGMIESNFIYASLNNAQEGLEMVNVTDYYVANNTISEATVAIALWKSQGNTFVCNTVSNARVGMYFLDSCQQTTFTNTFFGQNLETGLVLLDGAMISPQLNHGNSWELGNCAMDALYFGAHPINGANSENKFQVTSSLLPNGLNRIWVFDDNGTILDNQSWFKIAGYDIACPLINPGYQGHKKVEPQKTPFLYSIYDQRQDLHDFAMDKYQNVVAAASAATSAQRVRNERQAQKIQMRLSPQPAFDHLAVSVHSNVEPLSYAIYQMNGTLVMSDLTHAFDWHADLTPLMPGLYLIKVELTNGEQLVDKALVVK